jgi:hypothetical protein
MTDKKTTTIIDELEREGKTAYTTIGDSMRPLFKTHRDVVVLEKSDGCFKKYDIVLYPSVLQGKYLLHRVVAVKGDMLFIRGDNTYSLEKVPSDMVIAKLTSFVRKGKACKLDSFGYKLYCRIWVFIYPMRYVWFRIKSVFKAIVKKTIKVVKK